MKMGIIGLPQAGKTALYCALTGQDPSDIREEGLRPNIGATHFHDPRVDELAKVYKPKKCVYPEMHLVDMKGVSRDLGGGKSKGFSPEYIGHIKVMDALTIVVRVFEDANVYHPYGDIDPLRDAREIMAEMIFSDYGIAEKRLEKAEFELKKGRKEHEKEVVALKKAMAALEQEKLLQNVEFPSDEEKMIRGFQFLTLKPIIFILNVGEDQLDDPPTKDVVEFIDTYDFPFGKAALRLEQELTQMEEEERTEFMSDYGLTKSLVSRYEAVCYKALSYISFLTYGPEECRAWNVKRGSTAWEAGGRIHSDIQRGFIAAETIAYDAFVEVGMDEQAAKKKGLIRMEGKDYPVKDGDIIFYKFNV